EQLVNGLRNGFDHLEPVEDDTPIPPLDTAIAPKVRP
ncbi:MAG: TRAP transporter small permease, partial [Bradyrhizobium sp.]|nr:TRAP transporter small permease [Bradyrhizobium sp.]